MIRQYSTSFFLFLALGFCLTGCKDKNEPGPSSTTTTTTNTTTSGSTAGSTSGSTAGTTSGTTSATTSGTISGSTTSGATANTIILGSESFPLIVNCSNIYWSGLRDTSITCKVLLYGNIPSVPTTYTLINYGTLNPGQAKIHFLDLRVNEMWIAASGQLTATVVNGKPTATWNNVPMQSQLNGNTSLCSGSLTCR